jgi:hypothetical protein
MVGRRSLERIKARHPEVLMLDSSIRGEGVHAEPAQSATRSGRPARPGNNRGRIHYSRNASHKS